MTRPGKSSAPKAGIELGSVVLVVDALTTWPERRLAVQVGEGLGRGWVRRHSEKGDQILH